MKMPRIDDEDVEMFLDDLNFEDYRQITVPIVDDYL